MATFAFVAAPDQAHNVQAELGRRAFATLNGLSRGVALVDPSGRILLSNEAFRLLFDLESDVGGLAEAIGFNIAFAGQVGIHELPLNDGRTIELEFKQLDRDFIVIANDITQQLAEKSRIAAEARTDPLTLLGNRSMLGTDLQRACASRQKGLAFFAIDLDRFKIVNDTLGHPVGDALLVAVADRLRSALIEGANAYRVGGDEFGVLYPGNEAPAAVERLAGRIVDLLGRTYIIDGRLLNISASVGVASFADSDGDSERLLRCADLALYKAKDSGRSTYRHFEPEMDIQMQARRLLELDLRRAQALREFSLAYQPQYNLASKTVTGFEALLRWTSPSRGSVSPALFIPLAEELKLIIPIGDWVLRTACKQAAAWSDPLNIAVNVSAVQFEDQDFAEKVKSALAESNLAPRRLELEITESVLLGDKDTALRMLHSLRALGVRVSMDDFGTGYSSLSYLQSFPFDKIKIDQSFVRGNADEPNRLAIVRAIAALGQSLGMTTTAEGVETDEQLARIEADGCTDVQGYLISRPMPADDIEHFLTKWRSDIAC